MRVYAISDLHLLGGSDKSMSVFGSHWNGHFKRIGEDWRDRVTPEDLVLLPGDLSWAMKLEDALEDIALVAALPGRKVISRGNHDYWWNSISRVRDALPQDMYALQNDALNIENGTLTFDNTGSSCRWTRQSASRRIERFCACCTTRPSPRRKRIRR